MRVPSLRRMATVTVAHVFVFLHQTAGLGSAVLWVPRLRRPAGREVSHTLTMTKARCHLGAADTNNTPQRERLALHQRVGLFGAERTAVANACSIIRTDSAVSHCRAPRNLATTRPCASRSTVRGMLEAPSMCSSCSFE